jgi:sugar phosphate isomerase/epimerase
MQNRRKFLGQLILGSAALSLGSARAGNIFSLSTQPNLNIGLCELSLASSIARGRLRHLDFPAKAKLEWGITLVEYGSVFFRDKVEDQVYLKDMAQRASDAGVTGICINVEEEGELGSPDKTKREPAVQNHLRWISAARLLGCSSISVYIDGSGTPEEVAAAADESLTLLLQEAKKAGIVILVENHTGHSARGNWLSGIARQINDPSFGILIDPGNFCVLKSTPASQSPADLMRVRCLDSYDRYQGIQELMPYAKGIHAKTRKFDGEGKDIETDYSRMLEIINKSGFSGVISIEYEGGLYLPADQCSFYTDDRGISITKELLLKEWQKQ